MKIPGFIMPDQFSLNNEINLLYKIIGGALKLSDSDKLYKW